MITEYWRHRKESTVTEGYGAYRLTVRYFADSDKAQVTMEDRSARLPLLWSVCLSDSQANGALEIFKSIGYFDLIPTWEV